MKSIKEHVGGRPLSAVTPEKKVDPLAVTAVCGTGQLGQGGSSLETVIKCIIEVREGDTDRQTDRRGAPFFAWKENQLPSYPH